MPLGLIEEDEEIKEVTDRDYWLNRGTKTTVNMVDKMLDLINTFSNGYELKYNKYSIGMAMSGQPNNFVIFKPKKNFLRIEIKLPKSQETDQLFEVNDIDTGYTRWGAYNFNLMKGDIEKKRETILTLLTQAYNNFN